MTHPMKFVGKIFVLNDDEGGDNYMTATVTCRDRKQFREIAEGAAIALDESIRFPEPDVAFIGLFGEYDG
jgi:hypothetical protein